MAVLEAQVPQPMTKAERERMQLAVGDYERQIQLTRSGAAGVSQLRRMLIERRDALKHQLQVRQMIEAVEGEVEGPEIDG